MLLASAVDKDAGCVLLGGGPGGGPPEYFVEPGGVGLLYTAYPLGDGGGRLAFIAPEPDGPGAEG